MLIGMLCLSVFFGMSAASASQSAFEDPSSRSVEASGGLVATAPTVDGGAIALGSTAQVVVLFRNEGNQPVRASDIKLYPSSNISAEVAMNQCEAEPLPTAAECAIALSIKALQPGSWRIEMLVSHDGRTRLSTATITGSIDTSNNSSDSLISDIEALPKELSFGTLTESRSLVQSLIFRNVTSAPITINDIKIEAHMQAGFSLQSGCKVLNAGEACLATVGWAPVQRGPASGVIIVEHSGPTALTTVLLDGQYNPGAVGTADLFPEAVPGRGLLVSSEEQMDFANDVDSKAALTVSLVNMGDADVTISDVTLAGSDNGLTIEQSGCVKGTVLEPVEACPLTLTWTPTRVGNIYDDVQIRHSGARGILVLPVRGNAKQAVSKDSGAIVLNSNTSTINPGFALPAKMLEPPGGEEELDAPVVSSAPTSAQSNTSALSGYAVTSMARNRAIISGPGGSRVVFDREKIVIGGVVWVPRILETGIQFMNGGEQVLILFDRSLSTFDRSGGSTPAIPSASSDEG